MGSFVRVFLVTMGIVSLAMTGSLLAQKEEQGMAQKQTIVVLETNQGNIEIKLFGIE